MIEDAVKHRYPVFPADRTPAEPGCNQRLQEAESPYCIDGKVLSSYKMGEPAIS
jgi:hypothetical protein